MKRVCLGRMDLQDSSVKLELQGREDQQEHLVKQVLSAAQVKKVLQVNLAPEALQGTQDQMESKVTRDLQDLKESRDLWVNLGSRVTWGLSEKRVNWANWASEVLQGHLERTDIKGRMDQRVSQVTVDQWVKPEKGVRLVTLAHLDLLEILGKKATRDQRANKVCPATVDVQERRVKKGHQVTWERWALLAKSDRQGREDSKVLVEPEDPQVDQELWDLRENRDFKVTQVTLASQVQQAPRDQREKRDIQEKTVKRKDHPGP